MEFKNWYRKECPICHKMFETGRGNQHYCSEPCKLEGKRIKKQINNRKRYLKQKLEEEIPESKPVESRVELARANKEAWDKSRLSYGKYEAQKYIEQMRVKK